MLGSLVVKYSRLFSMQALMQGVQPEKPKGGAAGWGGEAQGGRGEGTGRGERSGGAGWGGSNEYGTSMEDDYNRLVQFLYWCD